MKIKKYIKNLFQKLKNLFQKIKKYLDKKGIKIRFIFFLLLALVSYLVCTISIFFTKLFVIPALYFIILLLSVYFISLDTYRFPKNYNYIIFLFCAVETLIFTILLGFSWFLIAEIFIFHFIIFNLYIALVRKLRTTTKFFTFGYFYGGGFLNTMIITFFFCLLMVHKYTELPFTCKDIETFPSEVVSTAMDPITSTWKGIKGIFVSEEEKDLNVEGPSEIQENKEGKVGFFSKITNYIKTETDINGELARGTCEYYLSYFKNPEYKGIEMVAVVVLYVLSIGVINTLLLFVTIVGLLLFLVLRFFHVYEYKTEKVDKESLV